eukprot:TRINITY_DN34122_c0_g1_i1.p1 TRINITY_DN34122_c0_g1~~TRINITY_DN34122_c0_g1_i1.p1  ORF type:complete len:540 (-),score=93.20 TRINITY_DN34122_c0_g1_i1:77-1645(-)
MGCGDSKDAGQPAERAPLSETKLEKKHDQRFELSMGDEEDDDKNEPEDPDVPLCKFSCGKPVFPGLTKRGNPFDTCCRSCALNKGLGVHDRTCGGKKPALEARKACKFGAKCRRRTAEHLKEYAHPLDEDYAASCATTRDVEAEPLSLKVLFDWTDADGSGKLSRQELESALKDIRKIAGFLPDITEESWHHLDEDGNGVVNFSEFASWAGPRLGLPLGMQKKLAKSHSMASMSSPCSVLGCPCECFEGTSDRCQACKHNRRMHVVPSSKAEVPSPEYWANHDGKFNERVDMGDTAIREFQQLFNRTYKSAYSRDRKKHNPTNWKVPSSFTVIKVQRNESSSSWHEYACKRAETLERIERHPVDIFADVKTVVAWGDIGGAKADRLAGNCNEWYLFHGTNPAAAESICSSDFKVSRAGSSTGTLYGKGLYFAESITKADEYAKASVDGNFAVLVCRVLGGNVHYTANPDPDPEELVHSCIEGPFDCVLGDRETTRGTYREFVLYDSEDVYAEYIVEYKRNYS